MPPADRDAAARKAARDRAMRALQGTRTSVPPVTPTITPPTSSAPVTESILPGPLPTPGQQRVIDAASVAYPQLQRRINDLRKELILKKRREEPYLSDEEILKLAEDELSQMVPKPVYAGEFDLTRPQAPSLINVPTAALATPENLPGEASMFEFLGARTKAPERAERAATVFDDIAFERSIASLPRKEQIIQRGTYEGIKSMFDYISNERPDLKTSEALTLAEDELADLQAAFAGKPSRAYVQPTLAAPSAKELLTGKKGEKGTLEKFQEAQVKSEARPLFMPSAVQKVFLEKFKPSFSNIQRIEAEEKLKQKPVEVTVAGPGGGSVKTTRAKTPEEVQKELAEAEKAGAFDLPIEFEPEKMKEFMADPEKFATGGIILDKEYPSGLIIESPANQLLRIAVSPLNAVAGFVGGLVKQIPGVVDLEELSASRPPKYRGKGIRENVIANIQEVGGFAKEGADIAQHNQFLKDNPEIAGPLVLGGVALDFIGVDAAILKGMAGFARGATTSAIAAKTAFPKGLKGAELTREIRRNAGIVAETSAREAASSFIRELNIPGAEKLATEIEPGDVRLTYGSIVGNQMIQKGLFRDLSSKIDSIADKKILSTDELLKEKEQLIEAKNIQKQRLEIVEKDINLDDAQIEKAFKDSNIERTPAFEKLFLSSRQPELDYDLKLIKERNEQIDKRLNEIDDLINSNKQSVDSLTSLNPITRQINDLLPIVVKNLNPEDVKKLAKARDTIPEGVKATGSNVLNAIKMTDSTLYNRLKLRIIQYAAYSKGVQEIDRALSRLGLKGQSLISVTPNLLATKKAAKAIEEEYKKSPFYTSVMNEDLKVEQKSVGNKLQNVVKLDDYLARYIRTVSDELKDRIKPDLYNRIFDTTNLKVGTRDRFILSSDLRELSYAVAESIAQSKKLGITDEMISEAPVPSGQITVGGKEMAARGARKAELVSDYPVWFNRLSNSLKNSINPNSSIYDPQQKLMMQNAKNRVGSIGLEFKDEFKLAKSDRDFRQYLNLKSGATDNEIIISLASNGGRSNRRFAQHLVDSMIYSTTDTPLKNAFVPNYNWGASVLKNKEAYKRLINEIAIMAPSDIINNLNDIFDSVKSIVDNDVNVELKAAGGRVMTVPPSLSKEVLISSYVRKKAEDILSDTMSEMYAKNPLQITEGLQSMMKLNIAGVPEYNETVKAFYKAVQENMQTGDLVNRIINAGPGSKQLSDIIDELVPYGTDKRGLVKSRLNLEIIKSLDILNETDAIDGILADIMKTTEAYKTFELADMVGVMDVLIKNKIPAGSFIYPELALQMKRDLGGVTEFNTFQKELAILSEEAVNGKLNSAGVIKFIKDALDFYNQTYYFLMLTINPRFHGVNNITAPLTIAYTTGRWPILNLSGGIAGKTRISPLNNYIHAANTVSIKGFSDAASRNIPVVTDRFGNVYTRGMLHDMAIKSGLFKSQFRAAVPTEIMEEIKSTIEPSKLRGPTERLTGQPLASYTDDVHRMTVVIDALSSGSTVDDALDLGRRSLFDYGDITEPEKAISRQFFIFYNFWRQSILQFVKNMISDPIRMIKYLKMSSVATNTLLGNQNARDLSFYYPSDWGVSRIVFKLEPNKTYNEGKTILGPQMPYADAINFVAQAIVSPLSLIIGPQKAGPEGGRAFEQGVVYERLGPVTKLLGQQIFTGEGLQNAPIKDNRIPIEHAAFAHRFGFDSVLQKLFPSFRWIKARPDEKSVRFADMTEDMVVEIDDEDTKRYKEFMNVLQVSGASRPLNEWSRMINTGVLNGPYPEGWAEWLGQTSGLITVTGAAIPEAAHKKAIEIQSKEVEKQVEALKKVQGRLPQKTR